MANPNNNVFGFANLPEGEPEEEEPNAPAPPAPQAERQRVYQLMKESTFQKLLGKGVPIQMSGPPSLRGYITAYMDLTPEQRRELESGWSRMRTSPTISRNLHLMAANRGRGYGTGYGGGGGGQRNRSRSRERRPVENNRGTRNRNRNENRNNRRTRNAIRNRERAEQNARRNGHASVLPEANDDQLAELLSGLRF